MKYVLVIFISHYLEAGIATQQVEFDSMEQCLNAKTTMETEFNNSYRDDPLGAITAKITTACLAVDD